MKKKQARKCGDQHVLSGRQPLQMGWYEFASMLVQGKSVLDVGCGSGEGLKLLNSKAKKAIGIDLDERLKRDDVEIEIKDISLVPDSSFDVVVCIDVIEHVDDDKSFVEQLVRIARELIFVSTPNYAVGRNLHPYHIREYAPYEFECIFSPFGITRVIGGDSSGKIRREITKTGLYYFLNRLYISKRTALMAKIVRRLLLTKIWAHQAVIVTLAKEQPNRPEMQGVCLATIMAGGRGRSGEGHARAHDVSAPCGDPRHQASTPAP